MAKKPKQAALPFPIPEPPASSGRDGTGRFVAGHKLGGRPVEDAELKAQCRAACADYVPFLLKIRMDENEPSLTRMAAAKELADRGYGKAVAKVESGGVNAFSGMTDAEVDALATELALKALSEGAVGGSEGSDG